MLRLTMANIKGTDTQCAPTNAHCGCLIKELIILLKVKTITVGTNANVLYSQSPSFVKQFTLAFTHVYYNFLALRIQQKGWRTD